MSETEAKYETDSWEQQNLNEELQNGQELRKNRDLIPRSAIVNFKDGSSWQLLDIYIHPDNISEEGYIEEIWIIVDTDEVELNGKTYTIYSHQYTSLIYSGEAWIDYLDFDNIQSPLKLSDNLCVKYIVNPKALQCKH